MHGARWIKSSFSFANGNCVEVAGNCAEVGQGGTAVLVRDTADRGGPVLAFSAGAWTAFLARVRG